MKYVYLYWMCINIGRERPKLKDIHRHFIPKWASKWRELSAQLNIDRHQMDIIENDHPNDCKRCCRKMLSDWLDSNSAACWEDITTAVDNILDGGM